MCWYVVDKEGPGFESKSSTQGAWVFRGVTQMRIKIVNYSGEGYTKRLITKAVR